MEFWRPGTIAPGSKKARGGNEGGEDEEEAEPTLLMKAYGAAPQTMSIEQLRATLPVAKHRGELLFLMENHRVVILHGQTGSGKTTQIPQYLHEAGYSRGGIIACTQPRRMTAISVANRVAEETGEPFGQLVGYAVRFDDKCSPEETRIKYMTDGMLFREALFDPLLQQYSVIMIDEAHERSLYTDLLLGLLKKIIRRRDDLWVIVSSATMDAEAFQKYFEATARTAILSVQGRMFPVDVFFRTPDEEDSEHVDVIELAAETVLRIDKEESTSAGDILVFLPGKEEIERCASLIDGGDSLVVLQLYASLPLDLQMLVFQPAPRNRRKVILSTNVAEASLTLEGIVFVVDCGLVKQKIFDPRNSQEYLLTTPISQASAQQRAGRAGRLRPGKAYRLYSEAKFASFDPLNIPEIQKCNLSQVVLQIKALGIDNLLAFDWLSPPEAESLASALELLYALEAIDDQGRLTPYVGVIMAEMPVDPIVAKILITSNEFGCGSEAVTLAAMLAARPVFVASGGQRGLEEAKRRLAVAEGDLISLVNIYQLFTDQKDPAKWCARNMLSYKALQRARRIRALFCRYMEKHGLSWTTRCKSVQDLQYCLLRGLFANVALAQSDGSYRSLRHGTRLHIHPSSVLFRRLPTCLLYYELVETGKCWMRDVTVIEQEWLAELVPSYYEYRRLR